MHSAAHDNPPLRAGRQFSLRTMLLVLVCLAVWAAGTRFVLRLLRPTDRVMVVEVALFTTPIWLPLAFLVYALGRRRCSPWLCGWLVVVEGLAVAAISFWTR